MAKNLQPLTLFSDAGLHGLLGTPGHQAYLDTARSSVITLVGGQAGCGKTFLAVAEALRCLKISDWCKYIRFMRPAQTSEDMGFLPGSLEEKTSVFMGPFETAACKLIGKPNWLKLANSDRVVMETFAHTRGDTFENCVVVVDEAQNCDRKLMELILTRVGKHCRMIVAGDPVQTDLIGRENGFSHALRIFPGRVNGLSVVKLGPEDNMRSEIVKQICAVYEEDRAYNIRQKELRECINQS